MTPTIETKPVLMDHVAVRIVDLDPDQLVHLCLEGDGVTVQIYPVIVDMLAAVHYTEAPV